MALARSKNYHVPEEHTLGTDWSSLSSWDSPPMEKLKDLIRAKMIGAVFMYEADRGPSKPVHRLLFRALCDQYGVRIYCCHGQVPEGEMGELMEFVSAWAKETQVHRAQQGARDGLRDRARIRGLPAVPSPAYGYRWNGRQFEPDPLTFAIARKIWEMAIDGVSTRRISANLTETGVPSPRGRQLWAQTTIAKMLTNPIYSGTYVALRTKAVEPGYRIGQTYGKTGRRRTDPADQVTIEGLVSQPIVSLDEFDLVQRRLARNKAQGGRASQDYLLRGRLRCACGKRWRGKTQRKNDNSYYRYVCPGRETAGPDRRSMSSVKGSHLEEQVWKKAVEFLTAPDVALAEVEGHLQEAEQVAPQLEGDIAKLKRSVANLDSADQRAYQGFAKGITSQKTYLGVKAGLDVERDLLADELQRRREALEDLLQKTVDIKSVNELRSRVDGKLANASDDDKRFVLDCLDGQVSLSPAGRLLTVAVPEIQSSSVNTRPWAGGWDENPRSSSCRGVPRRSKQQRIESGSSADGTVRSPRGLDSSAEDGFRMTSTRGRFRPRSTLSGRTVSGPVKSRRSSVGELRDRRGDNACPASCRTLVCGGLLDHL